MKLTVSYSETAFAAACTVTVKMIKADMAKVDSLTCMLMRQNGLQTCKGRKLLH